MPSSSTKPLTTLFGVWKFINNNWFSFKIWFYIFGTETKWRPWYNRLRLLYNKLYSCKTTCQKWQLLFNWLSKNSILLIWVCLKSFEICRIINYLRCMQQGGVYGVTKVSLVKQKISCCKCLFQNTVIVQDGSISMVYVCIKKL